MEAVQGVQVVSGKEFTTDEKADLFEWLMSQMRGKSLHMDGTAYWHMPGSTLWGVRARSPQEAVAASKARHDHWVAERTQDPQNSSTGAHK